MPRAIDKAARRWPNETRSKLLVRLVDAGAAALEEIDERAVRQRHDARFHGVVAALQ